MRKVLNIENSEYDKEVLIKELNYIEYFTKYHFDSHVGRNDYSGHHVPFISQMDSNLERKNCTVCQTPSKIVYLVQNVVSPHNRAIIRNSKEKIKLSMRHSLRFMN